MVLVRVVLVMVRVCFHLSGVGIAVGKLALSSHVRRVVPSVVFVIVLVVGLRLVMVVGLVEVLGDRKFLLSLSCAGQQGHG